MRIPILFANIIILALILAACGANSNPEIDPTANGMNISTQTDPSPARVGDVEVILTVKDAQGNPVTGANVMVFADHTDMSGMNMSGQATEQGNGTYAILANFSMSGNWMLTVDVKTASQLETQNIPLLIQ
jgi:hypothetical protein